MVRVTWYGTLTFGLVTVPVGLYVAREEQKTSFRQTHKGCGERIRMIKTCPTHGPLESDDITKSYEYAKDELVEIDVAEIDALAPYGGKSILIDRFVKSTDIDPLLFSKAYYLVPDKEMPQRQGYALLVAAMNKTKMTAIATFAHWGSDHVCAVRAVGNTLMMHVLFYAEDIRDPEPVDSMIRGVKVSRAETTLAVDLVNSLAAEWDHEAYKPEHRERIRQYVSRLVSGSPQAQKSKAKAAPKPSAHLLDALKASVAAASAAKKPKTKV